MRRINEDETDSFIEYMKKAKRMQDLEKHPDFDDIDPKYLSIVED